MYSNLGSSVSENDKIRTKNAIKSVAISAKVAIQPGAPGLHSGQSSPPAPIVPLPPIPAAKALSTAASRAVEST